MNFVRTLLIKVWPGEACLPISHPFGPEEAEERIRQKIVPFPRSFAREGLKGSVRHGRIAVYWRRPAFGSPWPAVFRGTVARTDGGCRIDGRISKLSLPPVAATFGVGCAAVLVGHRPAAVGLTAAAIGAVALAVGLLTLLQRVTHAERQKLLTELRNL